ncbi:hypothetical protein HU200_035108 [Digitaria exilis]|uniref:Leucine-rich repeat-containing N-terminal plant-type domain-containing protein n=1 Tax=Digitaria exilis TaxID=1010633 RepID=A0A835BP94_9POAL|nr:hypothetical protein HU200_035108 [Digitaria exilis]
MEFTNPRDAVTTAALLASAARTDGALCDKSDKAALLAVKSALGNPPALSGWNSTVACCSWAGISCNATTGRVTELTIFALNVSAPAIPTAIANLTALQIINLAYNQLHGGIPGFLGPHALPDLTFLRLDGNRLTGAIPPTATVFDLSLAGNLLAGELRRSHLRRRPPLRQPAHRRRKQLSALHLSRNRFEFDLGRVELPEVMDILEIDHNMVYGSIPADAAARKWLAFDVSYNQLCGPIPQGKYTHRFGPKHFAGNKCLCGRPLPPCRS